MTTSFPSANQWLVLLIVDITVPAMTACELYAGKATSKTALMSALFSIAALNAGMIVSVRDRNKTLGQATPRRLYVGAIGLAAISGLVSFVALRSIPERNEYLELALSNTPLDQIKPKQKAIVVELIRRNYEEGKAYRRAIAQQKPISPALYSPDSFANADIMRSVSEQFEKANEADFAHYDLVEKYMNDFRAKMSVEDPNYLESFEAQKKEETMQYDRAVQLQHQCLTETLALYDYAVAHTKEITVRSGEVYFTSDGVRTEFNRRLDACNSLYQQLQAANSEMIKTNPRLGEAFGYGPKS